MNLEFFTISLLNGLSYGLLLFMLSSGLTLIFSMMGVLNFAHASFYMVGAYIAYSTSQVIGFWWSLLVAPAIVFALGALFERWNKAVQSGDPEQVVANYAPKSVLLATLANKPLLTREDKLNYFTHFLEKKPSCKIDSHTVEIDCNTAVDAGLYTFTFGDGTQVPARFTIEAIANFILLP